MHFPVSIIIPVWNQPAQVGSTLASLASHTPEAQFIIVDLGSQPDTAQILQQFTEVLDDRVLLMHEPLNRGKTAALNRAIAQSESEQIAIVSTNVIVTPHWLLPLQKTLEIHEDVAIVCPVLSGAGMTPSAVNQSATLRELSRGSYACQLMRRNLFDTIGYFSEEFTCPELQLTDFSRRLWRAGYRTMETGESVVTVAQEPLYGSPQRRERLEAESRKRFTSLWEEPRSYCLCLADLEPNLQTIMTAARHGDSLKVLVPGKGCAQVSACHLISPHELVEIIRLPRFFAVRSLQKNVSTILQNDSSCIVVCDEAGYDLPALAASPICLHDFDEKIKEKERRLYGK